MSARYKPPHPHSAYAVLHGRCRNRWLRWSYPRSRQAPYDAYGDLSTVCNEYFHDVMSFLLAAYKGMLPCFRGGVDFLRLSRNASSASTNFAARLFGRLDHVIQVSAAMRLYTGFAISSRYWSVSCFTKRICILCFAAISLR